MHIYTHTEVEFQAEIAGNCPSHTAFTPPPAATTSAAPTATTSTPPPCKSSAPCQLWVVSWHEYPPIGVQGVVHASLVEATQKFNEMQHDIGLYATRLYDENVTIINSFGSSYTFDLHGQEMEDWAKNEMCATSVCPTSSQATTTTPTMSTSIAQSSTTTTQPFPMSPLTTPTTPPAAAAAALTSTPAAAPVTTTPSPCSSPALCQQWAVSWLGWQALRVCVSIYVCACVIHTHTHTHTHTQTHTPVHAYSFLTFTIGHTHTHTCMHILSLHSPSKDTRSTCCRNCMC